MDSAHYNPNMRVIYGTHEQHSCAAADGFARMSGKPGLVFVTSGPGITNILTSVCNAWYDSIPLFVVCGQVATNRLMTVEDRLAGMRARGFQETPIVEIFRPVTKMAVQVTHTMDVKARLDQLWFMATEGRPGPVLMDICDDIQRMEIDA